MPRKIKLENKVKKQKQKQTQKQVVKQSVVVRLDGIQRKKRQYKRRKQREPSEAKGKEQYQIPAPPLPPNVIYQSTQYLPYESPTVSEKIPLKSQGIQSGTPASMFQDVGVGTEGLVQILEKPTKKEQLQELTTPISIPASVKAGIKAYERSKPSEPSPFPAEDIPPQFNMPSKRASLAIQAQADELTKLQGRKAEPPAIEPSVITETTSTEPIYGQTEFKNTEDFLNYRDVILKQPKKSNYTWKYWMGQYKEKTGQGVSMKEAKQQSGGSLDNFISFVERIK